jgi:PII-like signaling protein
MKRISAVRALEGYGGASEIHRSRPVYHNLPVVITVIDTPERIGQLLPVVEAMMDTGTIATSPVEMLVVNRRAQARTAS